MSIKLAKSLFMVVVTGCCSLMFHFVGDGFGH